MSIDISKSSRLLGSIAAPDGQAATTTGHDELWVPNFNNKSLSIYEANQALSVGRMLFESAEMSKVNTAWVNSGGKIRPSLRPNLESLQPGLYTCHYDDSGAYLQRKVVNHDDLHIMPDDITGEMINDLDRFWSRRDKYAEYGITYKRGLLMYGPPGTGKTSMIHILVDKLINEYGGIAIFASDNSLFLNVATSIRLLEPDRPILAIIEELESYLHRNSENEFLSILDGELQLDNIVYLATTNYIERLPARIVNRPSRFDSLFRVDMPSAANRKFYLGMVLKSEDLASIDINRWVMDTDGMSLSHLKDLVVSVVVMGNPYEKAITKLKKMNDMDFE